MKLRLSFPLIPLHYSTLYITNVNYFLSNLSWHVVNDSAHFGHPYKKIDLPKSLPIENEHHMQILVRIGPTIVA